MGRFDELTRIGVDEFSYRKRHHYLTVVVDHDRRRVVRAGKGHTNFAESSCKQPTNGINGLRSFFVQLFMNTSVAHRHYMRSSTGWGRTVAHGSCWWQRTTSRRYRCGCRACEWLGWVARSQLGPLIKLARTIRKHAAGILGYLDTRMIIAMLFLCCGGIELVPPLLTRV